MSSQVPICAKCNREYRCVKIGVVLEMVAEWGSYYKVSADLYRCLKCGHEIYYGFADERTYNHEDSYSNYRSEVKVSV